MKIFLYIDPNGGSMIFQALIAGVLGVTVFFKYLKYKIIHFFTLKRPSTSEEEVEKIEKKS